MLERVLCESPQLDYTSEVALATDALYERVSHHIPELEWPFYAPYIYRINELKRERDAVILAHNYQTPEIYHCVSDYVGDSLQLAIEASRTKSKVIVQCGVHFMAETSKLLNPNKQVLIPDMQAGCSLAESLTGADIRLLREAHPNVPVVSYVNTSADVKAESDICCTSSNAVSVVESFGVEKVMLLPDEYLAENVARQTDVKIIKWKGRCEVHERFTPDELLSFRADDPDLQIIAHPECSPDVVDIADYTGSTKGMIDYVKSRDRGSKVLLVTECSMASNIEQEAKGIEFIKPCNLCPHMKRITLPKILDSLLHMRDEVHIDSSLAERARLSVERMINLQEN